MSLDKLIINSYNNLIQYFVPDFLWKVSLKILNLGIILKIFTYQGCGNTMPDLSDLVPFHLGQVENSSLLVFEQVQNLYKVNYYEFTCCIENSVDPDQLASSEVS